MGKLSFVTDIFSKKEANVIVLGVPIGKNSSKVIKKLREASRMVEPFDISVKKNLLQNVKLYDAGNVKLSRLTNITQKVKQILKENKVPLLLGGNHLLTYYSFKAFTPETKLIVFDAHADLKDKYMDRKIREMDYVRGVRINERLNDATWLRRVSEWHNPRKIMLVGIRSLDEEEFDFIKKSGMFYLSASEIKENLEGAAQTVRSFTKGSEVYVSLDIDVFDPSIAPATHYPEPDGISFKEFKELANAIAGRIRGIDVCCLKLDKGDMTEILAVRSLFELLSKI